MKTIIIKTQQSDKNGIGVYGNYNRTKKNGNDGLLFALGMDKKPFDYKKLNSIITAIIRSMAVCNKYKFKTEKDWNNFQKNKFSVHGLFVSREEIKKYYKNNIKLKFEVKVDGFKFKI